MIFSIKPGKPTNKSVFIFRILMLFLVLGAALLIFLFLHPALQKSLLLVYLTVSGLFAFLMIYSISGKVVTEFLIDTEQALLKINYFTVLGQHKVLGMPLADIAYSYKWKPSKYPPKKYRLRIYQHDECKFYMDSTDDGFSEEQFNELIEKFEMLKIKVFC